MPVEVIMPKVDMDMTSGRVMTWHVEPGAVVARGEPLFDIETDKAAMEVEAPGDGVLHHPVAKGIEVAIGQPVAWLYGEGEEVPDAPPSGDSADPPDATACLHDPDHPSEAPLAVPRATSSLGDAALIEAPAEGQIRATPRARSLARSLGIELSEVSGQGPRGRIQAGDVETLANAAATTDPWGGTTPAPAARGVSPEGGPLNVTRSRGGSGTPVLLIHGFASDAISWSPIESHLRHRPVIKLDLPGHGKSPGGTFRDFAELARELRTAFDALGLDDAHLVGHSLGGALALAIADTRPRKVLSLSLIAPAGLGPEINGAAIDGICRATRPASLGPWLRQLVGDEKLVTDSYIEAAFAARNSPGLRAAQQSLSDALFPDGVQAFDLRSALDRLDMPARIIWGKRDAIIPWRHGLAAPGRVALHLFDALGHVPQFEAPEDVGEIIGGAV